MRWKMKVILSRKGCPNLIMPDGDMLSLPIPNNDPRAYADLVYRGLPCDQLVKQLNPKMTDKNCHLDPDIRSDVWATVPIGWKPAFGQTDAAQGYLRNHNIGVDDLFLFFGWFRQARQVDSGHYAYVEGAPDVHAIFGYFQVGRVLSRFEDIAPFHWHPHADPSRSENRSNTLYLARDALTFDASKPGCGVLKYSKNRVLTMPGYTRATWREIPALMPENLSSPRKNSAKGRGVYYSGIWQEMVLRENGLSDEWAKSMIA
jgi:hypothetical protein